MVDVADDTASIGMQLLRDIHRIFTMAKKDRLPVAFLADRLTSMVDPQRDWNDLRGKPLDKFVLSKWLRPYGVQPKVMKIGGVSVRGYETTGAHGLSQAWARYTPDLAVTGVTGVTPQVRPVTPPEPITGVPVTTDRPVTHLTREVTPVTPVTSGSGTGGRVKIKRRRTQ